MRFTRPQSKKLSKETCLDQMYQTQRTSKVNPNTFQKYPLIGTIILCRMDILLKSTTLMRGMFITITLELKPNIPKSMRRQAIWTESIRPTIIYLKLSRMTTIKMSRAHIPDLASNEPYRGLLLMLLETNFDHIDQRMN